MFETTSKTIKTEILAGMTSAVVTMPVAIAYGYASGLGPYAGFVSAIVLGFVAALVGGTSGQISSPTGALTVAISVFVVTEIEIQGSLEAALPVLMAIFVLAGCLQLFFGLLKLGENIQYIPFSVISGFMSGVGLIIIVLQIPNTFGVPSGIYTSVISKILNIFYFFDHANWLAFAFVVTTVGIIYIFPKITKKIPSSLVALLVLTGLVYIFELDIDKLGAFSIDLSRFSLISLDQLSHVKTLLRILIAAASLAFIGSVNTLLTSVVADKMTNSVHNSNQELMGQGIGNLLAGFLGGFTGSGATACAVANIQAGGRNRISGITTAFFLLIFLIWGGDFIAEIPLAVISGIMISIGYELLDKVTLKKLIIIPRVDAFVMVAVMGLTAFYDLLFSVSLGLIISAIYFMKKMADQVEDDSNQSKLELMIYELIDTFDDAENFKDKVFIKTIKGPLFFGFSARFLKTIRAISPNVEVVVFNMSLVPYMDYSGIRTFKDAILYLKSKNIKICFCELNKKNQSILYELDLIPNQVPEKYIFDSIESCVMWLDEPGNIDGSIQEDSHVYFPTAFTPNDDGIKDEWVIMNIEKYANCHIQITAPDSTLVFESQGYTKAWDGIFNDESLPKGSYNYVCQLDPNDPEEIKGTVNLIR
jgi:SulP family sulfate permease|tara:strand:- start:214 stop:2154 length:1941 start_codon:yes stop_codon:yes gene_type:complete